MFNKLIQFLKEVRTELKRVTWPTRKQVINSTGVVLITVAVVSTFLWIIDISLQGLISRIIR
jgi:preprotein translocase subunit SecE